MKSAALDEWMGETVAWYIEGDVEDAPYYDPRYEKVDLCLRWQKGYGYAWHTW